jgi:hypothetical protein
MPEQEVSFWIRLKDGVSQVIQEAENNFTASVKNFEKGALVFAGLFAGVAAAVYESIKTFGEHQAIVAQTEAVLTSTGHAAGMTKDEVVKLSEKMMDLTGIDHDAILSGENMILTFTQIHKNIFPEVTKTAMDMTAAMNGGIVTSEGMRQTAIQMGKALNDPVKGISALHRVGVAFTEQQKDQIKKLQESGDMLGAQTIILKELQTEFGGSSEKLGTFAGAFNYAKNMVGELEEAIGEALMPVFQKLTVIFIDVTKSIVKFMESHKDLIAPIMATAAALTGSLAAISAVTIALPVLAAAFAAITGPIGLVAIALSAITGAVTYFSTSNSEMAIIVRTVWTGTGMMIKEYAGAIWTTIKDLGAVFLDFGNLMKAVMTGNISEALKHANALKKHAFDISDAYKKAEEATIKSFENAYEYEKKHASQVEEIQKKHNIKAAEYNKAAAKQTFAISKEALKAQQDLDKQAAKSKEDLEKQKQLIATASAEQLKLITKKIADDERDIADARRADEMAKRIKDAKDQEDVDKINRDILDLQQKRSLANQLEARKITVEQEAALKKGLMNTLDDLAQLEHSKNRTAFEIGKQAAAAKVLINAAQAIMGFWAGAAQLGPIAGPIVAGVETAIVAGIAIEQTGEIERQNFPAAAMGALVTPQGGGALVQVGENAQEAIMNSKLMKDALSQAARQSSTTVNFNVNGRSVQAVTHVVNQSQFQAKKWGQA